MPKRNGKKGRSISKDRRGVESFVSQLCQQKGREIPQYEWEKSDLFLCWGKGRRQILTEFLREIGFNMPLQGRRKNSVLPEAPAPKPAPRKNERSSYFRPISRWW